MAGVSHSCSICADLRVSRRRWSPARGDISARKDVLCSAVRCHGGGHAAAPRRTMNKRHRRDDVTRAFQQLSSSQRRHHAPCTSSSHHRLPFPQRRPSVRWPIKSTDVHCSPYCANHCRTCRLLCRIHPLAPSPVDFRPQATGPSVWLLSEV